MEFEVKSGIGTIYCCDNNSLAQVEYKIHFTNESESRGVIKILDVAKKEINDVCNNETECLLELSGKKKYLIHINKKYGFMIPFTILEEVPSKIPTI